MGFFDRFKQDNERSPVERIMNDGFFKGSFLSLDEWFQCFSQASLEDDEPIRFCVDNAYSDSYGVRLVGGVGEVPVRQFEFLPGNNAPFILFTLGSAEEPQHVLYGAFMNALESQAEVDGWEWPYRISFKYLPKGWLCHFDANPIQPKIAIDPDDPGRIIVSGADWKYFDNITDAGMGGWAAL